jgi:ribosome biogenesis protein BMS1
MEDKAKKPHRARQAGPKAEKRKKVENKKKGVTIEERQKNPKVIFRATFSSSSALLKHTLPLLHLFFLFFFFAQAFGVAGGKSVQRSVQRKSDKEQTRIHIPVLEQAAETPPPFVVAVVGPPKVKYLFISCFLVLFCFLFFCSVVC